MNWKIKKSVWNKMDENSQKMIDEFGYPILVGDYYFAGCLQFEMRKGNVTTEKEAREISNIVAHIDKMYSEFK